MPSIAINMYTNVLTSLGLPTAKIPMYFDTDREAISQAISSVPFTSTKDPEDCTDQKHA
jgi:hypothetical protein